MKHYLEDWTQTGLVNASNKEITAGVCTMSYLWLCDLEEEGKLIHVKLAVKIKLVGLVDIFEGSATIQRDLDRLREQDNWNLLKFNKYKWKFSDTGWGLLGWEQLWRKGVGILVAKELSIGQYCVPAAMKSRCILYCMN